MRVHLLALVVIMGVCASNALGEDATLAATFDPKTGDLVEWEYAARSSTGITGATRDVNKDGNMVNVTYKSALGANAPALIPLSFEFSYETLPSIQHLQYYEGRIPKDLSAPLPVLDPAAVPKNQGWVMMPVVFVAWETPGRVPVGALGEVDIKQAITNELLTDANQFNFPTLEFSPAPNLLHGAPLPRMPRIDLDGPPDQGPVQVEYKHDLETDYGELVAHTGANGALRSMLVFGDAPGRSNFQVGVSEGWDPVNHILFSYVQNVVNLQMDFHTLLTFTIAGRNPTSFELEWGFDTDLDVDLVNVNTRVDNWSSGWNSFVRTSAPDEVVKSAEQDGPVVPRDALWRRVQ